MCKRSKASDFEDDRQQRVDADAKLKSDIQITIRKLSRHCAYDKRDLETLLKRCYDRIDRGLYG